VKLPVTHFSQLASTTKLISTSTGTTYHQVEEIERDYFILQAFYAPSIKKKSFHPTANGINVDITSNLESHANALSMISTYMQILYELSAKDFGKGLDSASGDLGSSAQSFSGKEFKLSTSQSTSIGFAFGGIADLAGKRIVYSKRLKALKTAMDSANKYIDTLTKLLIQDNKILIGTITTLRDQYLSQINGTRSHCDSTGRFILTMQAAKFMDDVTKTEQNLTSIDQALEKLPAAHKAIRLSLDSSQKAVPALKAFIAEAKSLGPIYSNIYK
jgi:hypothetical protein